MLDNKKKVFIYNLCFGLSKLYINSQQDEKAEIGLSYVNVVCVYGGTGGGGGLEVFKCFVRGVRIFSSCFVCVCVWGGQVQCLSFREKNNRPPPINT